MLKNIQPVMQMPVLPGYIEDQEEYKKAMSQYNNDLQRALEDYTRNLADNIMEQPRHDDLSNAIIASRLDSASGRLNYDYFNAGVSFASNARYPDEPVVIPVQGKHSMKYGSGMKCDPHFHWLQEQVEIPNMLLAVKITNYDGELTTKETDWSNYDLYVTERSKNTYVSGVLPQITFFPELDISNLKLSGSIDYVLFRDSGNVSGLFDGVDPVAGDVTVKYSDAHYLFDSIGSRERYNK